MTVVNDLFEMRARASAAVRAAAVGLSEEAITALTEHLLREGAIFTVLMPIAKQSL